MTREEAERQAEHRRRNLAADLRGRGHRLAALLVAGGVNVGVADHLDAEGADVEVITEDQAAAALELGEAVVVWRPPA